MPNFANLAQGESPSLYSETEEDVAIKAETSGGYELTRPRFTRAPRREFTGGWLKVTNADKLAFDAFYKQCRTFVAFAWTNFITGETVQVRFKDVPKKTYQGVGKNVKWDISYSVREV